MFVVDTNVFVYAAIRQCPEHEQALAALERWRSGSELWFATWSIVYELLRVVTHPRIFPTPLTLEQGWRFVESLVASPSFGLLTETERHLEIVRDLSEEYPRLLGNRVHDLHIAALMAEHGVAEIRTADTDFYQFRFLRVANPLTSR